MEKSPNLSVSAALAGLYIGIASIVYFMLLYVAGIMPVGILKPIVILLLGFAISILILIVTLKNFRTAAGGYITFLNAFLFSAIALILSTIIYVFFNYLFLVFFEPDYIRNIMEAQLTWTENFMVKQGLPDDQIDKALSGLIEQMNDTSPVSQAFGKLHYSILFNVVVALIIAAIFKKPKSIFEESEPTVEN